MIKFQCNKCGFAKDVSDKYLNKRVRCPKCQAPNLVSQIPKQKTAPPQNAACPIKAVPANDVLRFSCPSCALKVKVKSEYAGKRVRCAKCKNPLTVPGGQKAEPRPAVVDAASVLRAGNESADRDDFGSDAFSRIDSLLAMEQNSQTVERPEGDRVAPAEDEASEEISQPTSPRRGGGKSGSSNTVKALIISGSIIAYFLVIIIIFVASIASSAKEIQANFTDAKVFAAGYIELLTEGKFDEAAELMHIKLQNESLNQNLEKISEYLNEKGSFDLHTKRHCGFKDGDTEGFTFSYAPASAELSKVTLIFESSDEGFILHGITTQDKYTNNKDVMWERGNKILVQTEIQLLNKAGNAASSPGMITAIVLVIIFGLFMIATMYTVYEKAGQPGWAIFVPAYGQWILAEIAEKPGWWGLVIFFSGFIPFGGVISFILSLIIAIGIARVFEKGILFGLGLSFLPLIFYPILAFTGDKFQGMEYGSAYSSY